MSSWNSGQAVGPKTEFSKSQIQHLETLLLRDQNWHDLALISLALDSMLRASDLLSLQVQDVQTQSGNIRQELRQRQQKTHRNVYPVLSTATQWYLAHWIEESAKEPLDYCFTRSKAKNARPISRGHYAALVKTWAEWLSLPSEDYSTHSLRRSKPSWMFAQGEPIELISQLLGHKSVAVTVTYLGINQKKAAAAALRHPMMKGPPKEILQRLGTKSKTLRRRKLAKSVKSI